MRKKINGVIPAIKKDITSFLMEERGDISKQVLISLGAMIAGLEALNIVTKGVNAQSISAKHQHCDQPHSSCSGWCGGWCHGSSGGCGSHSSCANPGHLNNIVLNYG